MKITDGKKTVDIRLVIWEGSGYSPDWSTDFFNAGLLEYDRENDVYIVDDVDYCIEQAEDWRDSRGDFSDDEPSENNRVFLRRFETMYWCIKGGDVYRVEVKPMQQQRSRRLWPVTVYRSVGPSALLYSAKHIRKWEELTPDQKKKAYRNAYQANRQDALWQIAKDPTLEPQYKCWVDQLKQERDAAISAIDSGEDVEEPRRVWE